MPKPLPAPGRYAQILYDDIFKLILAAPENRDLLMMLLNLLLPGLDITEITFLDKEQHGFAFNEKKCIFDVYCETARKERIVVEMQYSSEEDFLDRTLFYATYPIREQLVTRFRDLLRHWRPWLSRKRKAKKMQPYRLRPVYVVSILNFSLKHGSGTMLEDGLVSRYELREQSSGELMTGALHFVFLELGRMTYGAAHPEKCRTVLEKLAFSLKYMTALQGRPGEMLEEIFQRLFDAAEIASMSAEERKRHDKIMTTRIDIIAGRHNSYVEGLEEGMAKGMEEGFLRMAEQLRKTGMSEEEIEEMVKDARS